MPADVERAYRQHLWEELKRHGGSFSVAVGLLRELMIYSGQRGIWMDKKRTSFVSPVGVTVSLKHTGRHYPDDLSEDGLIYHYPVTQKTGHDKSEIAATKEARALNIPVFVIVEISEVLRNVYLGQVVDWDDIAKQFWIEFVEDRTATLHGVQQSNPIQLFDNTEPTIGKRKLRPGQAKFKFETIKRYGPSCAFCDIKFVDVLDAVHLISKAEKGSDDCRNGLVLCATHHRMLDSGLVHINPETLELHPVGSNTLSDLYIRHTSINHLPHTPDRSALAWCWKKGTSSL